MFQPDCCERLGVRGKGGHGETGHKDEEMRKRERMQWGGSGKNEPLTTLLLYIYFGLIILYLEPSGKVSTWIILNYKQGIRACFIFHDQFTYGRFNVCELHFAKSQSHFNWQALSEAGEPP